MAAALVLIVTPRTNLARRILASGPLVWLGTISYSAYLVHWPVWCFGLYAAPSVPRWQLVAWCIATTVGGGAALHAAVETPMRQRSGSGWDAKHDARGGGSTDGCSGYGSRWGSLLAVVSTRRLTKVGRVWGMGLLVMATFAAAASAVWTGGWSTVLGAGLGGGNTVLATPTPWPRCAAPSPAALPSQRLHTIVDSGLSTLFNTGTECVSGAVENLNTCAVGRPSPRSFADFSPPPRPSVRIVTVGDSFAERITWPLCLAAREAGAGPSILVTSPACSATFGVPWEEAGPVLAAGRTLYSRRYHSVCRTCHAAWKVLGNEMPPGTLFVLAGQWHNYQAHHARQDGASISPPTFSRWMATTIGTLCARGHSVVVVGVSPNCVMRIGRADPSVCLASPSGGTRCTSTLPPVATIVASNLALKTVVEAAGATFIDPYPYFCPTNGTCDIIRAGLPLYDNNHMAQAGAMLLTPALTEALQRHALSVGAVSAMNSDRAE